MRRLVIGLAFVPWVLAAQTQAGSGAPSAASLAYGHRLPVPNARAVRRAGSIVLDAKLDEPVWQAAQPISQFTQSDPNEGQPASQHTEVRFVYDDDALYVGAKMYDSEGAHGVMTRLVRHDATFDSDYLQVVIDGYHDHLSRAFFEVNPSGAKSDYIGVGTSCCDNSWDPVWEAATHIDADGWTAEIRIPYSQLRFSRDSIQTWGLEVRRFIKRNNEEDDWSFWRKNEAGGPSRFGHLEGLRIPATKAGLELLPYVVSKSASFATERGDPFATHGRPTFRAGLDVKDRLTSNLTLDATFNPDFGQVEVDPAVLNLSAFETFFPEKRPFFVEGAQVFDFGQFGCNFCSNVEGMRAFYSRRIGRAPTGASLATDNYTYADVPDATTILGAGKVTGRTASGYTVGLLDAVTGSASARVQSATGDRGTQPVEPLADYFVGRLKRDYMRGNLVVGGIVSGVARNIDSTFAPRLARHAELYGSDVQYTWREKMYLFSAQAALTNVSGDAREIVDRQQSSARYFQRPDRGAGSAGWLSNRFDSTASSLRGAGAYLRLAKQTGDVFGEVAFNTRTPGYETNDYAFQQRADYLWSGANIGRQWVRPTSWYRQLVVLAGGQAQRDYEGDWLQSQVHTFVETTTPQFWNISWSYIHRPQVMDPTQLRGGPAVATVAAEYTNGSVNTDSRRALVFELGGGLFRDRASTLAYDVEVTANYRPLSNVSLSVGPALSNWNLYEQYVTRVADTTAASFAGSRYVSSRLHQQTFELDTRASITFTPTMSLEVFLQPFFAAGHYHDFEEYARPRSNVLETYGRDRGTIAFDKTTNAYTIDPDGAGPAASFNVGNPDFTDRSLRGNAVFRWEFRPGSVLYVAWTQSRDASAAFGNLAFGRDRTALLATRPDDIFLVKASWWLPW